MIFRVGLKRGATALGVISSFYSADILAQDRASDADQEVSLSEILTFADTHAPAILFAKRDTADLAAMRAEADVVLPENPTLELSAGPRFEEGADTDFDFSVGISQPVEIAGQGNERSALADRAMERVQAEIERARWLTRCDVTSAFYANVVARQRSDVARDQVMFAEELARIAHQQLGTGEINRIEAQLAETDLAEARQSLIEAEQGVQAAQLRLVQASGWPIEHLPVVTQTLEATTELPAVRELLRVAQGHAHQLEASRRALAEARQRVGLADRDAWPDPVLGVSLTREGAPGGPPSYIVLGSLGVPLPLWQRNQSERRQAEAQVSRALVQWDMERETLFARLVEAHGRARAALQRITLSQTQIAALEANMELVHRALLAGEISFLAVAAARQRFFDARVHYLNAFEDYYESRADLERSMGVALSTLTHVEAP